MASYRGQTEEESLALDIEYYGEADMSWEDLIKYHDQVAATGGYDVDLYPGFACNLIYPLKITEEAVEDYKPFAEMALGDYNKRKCENFKFVELLKLNIQASCGTMSYLTFKAKDADNGRTETFQAKILEGIPKKGCDEPEIEVLECRIKPTTSVN